MYGKKLDFAAIYSWLERHSSGVLYRSHVDTFESLFAHYVATEEVYYSASRICQMLRGSVSLPRDLITRYRCDDVYIESLMDAVKALITLDIADAPAALEDLAQMIAEDDTISEIQKRNLLCNADVGGGDSSIKWVTDIVRFAMLPRRDARRKIA